ncbi:MAG: SUMF1/EgtB/PvdO family nonheme iron enzyme [Sandaracinaceae bacterium]|nr:SUMF1/EgtB/PvdO family nonheme iron enzyme [Sandaracinaceae bacterium]
MNRWIPYFALFFAIALVSCGDPPTDPPGTDAGSDAGATSADAGDAGGTGFDAGSPDEPCDPGEVRFVTCGRCGGARQECGAEGRWGTPGACSGEGVCIAGEPETENTLLCGERTRRCTEDCDWGEWRVVVPDGECMAGETSRDLAGCGPSEVEERTCQADCTWTAPVCVDACGGVRRTSPADAEEICIPAGLFNRGLSPPDDYYVGSSPMAEVYVSAYYIDRFPVTNQRYQACIDAGGCPPIVGSTGASRLANPDLARNPVREVPFESAVAFCMWDGGRRVPTEAEWEKAARGPAPREVVYPWGDDSRCELYINCGQSGELRDVDAHPLGASYYGVERLVGGGLQWVSDYWSEAYYLLPESRTDPTGPATVNFRVRRGWQHSSSIDRVRFPVFYRYRFGWSTAASFTTIRCARGAT